MTQYALNFVKQLILKTLHSVPLKQLEIQAAPCLFLYVTVLLKRTIHFRTFVAESKSRFIINFIRKYWEREIEGVCGNDYNFKFLP